MMKGSDWLDKLYSVTASQACQMMTHRNHLRQILLDKNLLILLRHIQNIAFLDACSILRTLLLTMQLKRLNSKRFSEVFSQTDFSSVFLNPKLGGQEETYFNNLVRKIGWYIQLSNITIEDAGDYLERLTEGVFFLRQGCKNTTLRAYGQFFQQVIEQICFQFWKRLQKQMAQVQQMQEVEFMKFYKKYCAFCSSRRRIPKLVGKNLKNVQINRQKNQKIQFIFKHYQHKQVCQRLELQLQPRIAANKILALMQEFDQEDQ